MASTFLSELVSGTVGRMVNHLKSCLHGARDFGGKGKNTINHPGAKESIQLPCRDDI